MLTSCTPSYFFVVPYHGLPCLELMHFSNFSSRPFQEALAQLRGMSSSGMGRIGEPIETLQSRARELEKKVGTKKSLQDTTATTTTCTTTTTATFSPSPLTLFFVHRLSWSRMSFVFYFRLVSFFLVHFCSFCLHLFYLSVSLCLSLSVQLCLLVLYLFLSSFKLFSSLCCFGNNCFQLSTKPYLTVFIHVFLASFIVVLLV